MSKTSAPKREGEREALFGLLSTRPSPPPAEGDWPALLFLAAKHLLLPLLHWRLTHEKADLPVPSAARQALGKAFRGSALRALAAQRELLLAGKALDAAKIPCAALKGAFLAFHAYPNPALRSLRDLDLLVPADAALRAYEVLLGAGWSRIERHSGDPRACLAAAKHLPPLSGPSGTIPLELHVRLVDARVHAAEVFNGSGLWERLIERPAAGRSLRHLSPADQLLHLILHALYDHRLANGPLILSDLFYLRRAGEIDWDLFWRLSRAGGWEKGARLLLDMAERFHGAAGEDGEAARDCAALMLRPPEEDFATNLAFQTRGKSAMGRLRVLCRRAFPPRAALAGGRDLSGGYLRDRAKVIARRAGQALAVGRSPSARGDAERLARLERWLSAP